MTATSAGGLDLNGPFSMPTEYARLLACHLDIIRPPIVDWPGTNIGITPIPRSSHCEHGITILNPVHDGTLTGLG